ncbi:MAG: ABC transporter substrate-binding protein, partial [Gammaproteobacteria bacterium]|nr:ABC transporter substrate-binding protein [Gammaproteobacteria bacterium]
LNGKQKKPRVLFLLSVSNGTPLAAGVDTSASSIIELAGGVNAVGGFTGYKPLSLEAAVAAEPEFILMMTHSARELGGAEQILALPQLRLTPAASDKRLIIMDGLLLLGFGARTDCAAYLLATKLHANENLPKPDQCQAT